MPTKTKNQQPEPDKTAPLFKRQGKPALTNRGGAGLRDRRKRHAGQEVVFDGPSPGPGQAPSQGTGKKNNIAPGLLKMAVSIEVLVPDPMNARLHPERNIEAIKDSLRLYGQQKPVVVRKETGVVVAGNGTLEAAKALGWTKLAAVFNSMDELTAMGYGLADNRTAELAKWDFETVARVDRLMAELGAGDEFMAGWSPDEVEVLRAADWTPPAVDPDYNLGEDGEAAGEGLTVTFQGGTRKTVEEALAVVLARKGNKKLDEAAALATVCFEWLEAQKPVAAVNGTPKEKAK